jgi:hypothetical protein
VRRARDASVFQHDEVIAGGHVPAECAGDYAGGGDECGDCAGGESDGDGEWGDGCEGAGRARGISGMNAREKKSCEMF